MNNVVIIYCKLAFGIRHCLIRKVFIEFIYKKKLCNLCEACI